MASAMRHSSLRGRNLHGSHLRTAKSIAKRLSEDKRVEGVIFLGGLTRGFADRYSDIDMAVLVRGDDGSLRRSIERMSRAESLRTGFDMDLEVHSVKGFSRLERTDWRRREYADAEVVYDRDGAVARLVSQMVSVPEGFWVDRIVKDWMYLQWYACPEKGFKSIAEIWVERGDVESALHCLNYSMDLLLELLFALNRQFTPVPKWRLHHARGLEWKPKGFATALRNLLAVDSMTSAEVARRAAIFRKMRSQLERRVVFCTGLSHEALVRRFVDMAVYENECGCRDLNPGLKLGKLQS